jgi:hypothetical protein
VIFSCNVRRAGITTGSKIILSSNRPIITQIASYINTTRFEGYKVAKVPDRIMAATLQLHLYLAAMIIASFAESSGYSLKRSCWVQTVIIIF